MKMWSYLDDKTQTLYGLSASLYPIFSKVKTGKDALQRFNDALEERYGKEEATAIFRFLLAARWNTEGAGWRMMLEHPLTAEEQAWFLAGLEKLEQGIPVQYVTGFTWFGPLKLMVKESVLIPRPETEELCQWIREQGWGPSLRVVDACTGSGCIPLLLKHWFPQWNITGFDVSASALEVAKANARTLNLEVDFQKFDLAGDPSLLPEADVIVSNPPYVPLEEAPTLMEHVVAHEPALALFAPQGDPLFFYRHLEAYAKEKLAPGGHLIMEIHKDYGEETRELFTFEPWASAHCLNDIHGKPRFIHVVRQSSK